MILVRGLAMATKTAKKSNPKKSDTAAKKPEKQPAKKTAIKKSTSKLEEKPKEVVRKKRESKGGANKIAVGISLEPKSKIVEPVISRDEIALRAYFIAERRHKMGWPGNSATDWIDAENQLKAEALEKPLKKR
jgi:hypothetical protein